MLGVLRDGDMANGTEPQPELPQISLLAQRMSQTGLAVAVQESGDLASVPTAIGLSLYRIAQESLTNVLKHAGEGAKARISVVCLDDSVTLEVSNSGSSYPPITHMEGTSGHNGIIGMRERATVLGGTLESGPQPGGGWRVFARVPLKS
jgi:signal transduction histidine kinase